MISVKFNKVGTYNGCQRSKRDRRVDYNNR